MPGRRYPRALRTGYRPAAFAIVCIVAAVASLGIGGCDSDEKKEAPEASNVPADPLPGSDEPGLVTCDGCPEVSGIDDFEPDFGNASAQVITGNVSKVQGEGEFYVHGENGEAYGGKIQTDSEGGFSVNVPLVCGRQTIKLAWTNDRGRSGAVMNANTSGCRASDIRITLSWNADGNDFELHLVREGGTINDNAEDCTWTSCIGASPDWGRQGDATDNPTKDVDDVDAFGPENIVYPDPAEGRYTVLVEHWGQGSNGATGTVVINVKGRPPVQLPIEGLDPKHVLIVATIDWPGGEVKPVLTDHDCSGSWAGGCHDEIP